MRKHDGRIVFKKLFNHHLLWGRQGKDLTKTEIGCIIDIEKGKTSNGYAKKSVVFTTAVPVQEGGYCAFMDKIINKAIISKTAKSNFFAICIPPFLQVKCKHLYVRVA